MKIPRHTAGNLSLQRISIAITLVYSNTLSEELQEVLLIFRILYCKFFVNRKKRPLRTCSFRNFAFFYKISCILSRIVV